MVHDSAAKLETELAGKYGEPQRARLQRGLRQVGQFWRAEDGDAAAFEAFVRENFAGDQATLDAVFDRFSRLLEKLGGHTADMRYELRRQADLDLGPLLPLDETAAGYDPGAHLTDDFFANKLAFVVLLNFPLTNARGAAGRGGQVVAAAVGRDAAGRALRQTHPRRSAPGRLPEPIGRPSCTSAEYKICMHHLLDAAGRRPFPPKLRLVAHWNLRDEIKAQYPAGPEGLAKQRMIERVLERIVDQSIPQAVDQQPAGGLESRHATKSSRRRSMILASRRRQD